MSVQLKGSGTIGGLDEGLVISGIVTSSTQINVGSNIKIGNAGVVTATTFSGSGASLTNLPAGNLTGALPAISGANLTGIDTDLVSDTSPQLGGNLDTNSKNIVFGDSSGTTVNRLTFGGQADMKFYHDGTNSVITNATGDLYINNNADTIIKPANDCFIKPQDGENGISVIGNGAVELYHDNTKRFETTSIGAKVSANSSVDGLLVTASQEGTVTVADERGASFKASFLMAGSAPVIRNQNTSTSDSTLSIQKGASTVATWNGDGHYLPGANNTYDIGSTSVRWRNIYTNDLNLSNKGSTNSVDNTWGDYTIQEGESDLFLINNRNGKKYKFNLTEVS